MDIQQYSAMFRHIQNLKQRLHIQKPGILGIHIRVTSSAKRAVSNTLFRLRHAMTVSLKTLATS